MSLTVIRSVDPRSPAQRAGVRPGETLTHINGHPVADVLDYKVYSYDPRLELKLREKDGSERTLHIRKGEGEDLGLEFETYLMDRARSCANNCIFCFVDQMPPGMRPSLYFKDDDARLSFLLGNYLTLTNMSDREVQRIIDLRISPINISVHTTDPELRAMMLKNKRAGRTIDIMRRFAEHHIIMNCQIVSCPGINDGPALDKTLNDLAEMFPSVNSVSVVPVGVTKFREGLYPLKPYTPEQAGAVIVWSCNGPCAAVSADGTVTNLNTAAGTVQATITATWSGKSASCTVDCQPAQRTGTVFDADVGLNVRSGPGTTNPVVDRRSNGDVLIVESVENGWCKVLYRNAAGQAARGYVSADYLQLSN